MLIVTGIIEVDPGDVGRLVEAAKTAAAETRKEAGCKAYAFFEDIETPGRFRVYEEWEDQAALSKHFTAPHMAAFNAALKDVTLKSINVVKFEPGPISPLF